MSDAFAIHLKLQTDSNKFIPSSFVAKFLKDDVPFKDMIRVEMSFYTTVASRFDLPFRIPRLLHASDNCIIIEFVPDVDTFSVMHPCPDIYIEPVIIRMAEFHAMFWKYDCAELASPAGIGSELDGLTKETRFPALWEGFLSRCDLNRKERDTLRTICQQMMDQTPLSSLHDELHDNDIWTMIHGDFHIGNILISSDNDLWLIDWATCGKGNPLRDVTFFFIVSCPFWTCDADSNSEHVQRYLKLYHDTLSEAAPDHLQFSMEQCQEAYRKCVLNQFAILVCYDEFCTEFANSAKEEGERVTLRNHFERVNLRACFALMECFRLHD